MKTRYEWILVIILSLNFGVVFFDRNALNFLMPFIQKELNLTNTMIGGLSSALALSWAVSGMIIGRISDTLNQKKLILVICVLVFSCASFISGLAGTFAALMGARFLMGIAEGGVAPISQTMIASQVNPNSRGLAQGIMQTWGSALLGQFIASILLVWIGEKFGWRHAFLLTGIPGIIMAAMIYFFVKDNPIVETKKVKTNYSVVIKEVLTNKNIIICTSIATLMIGYLMVYGAFMPLILTNGLHIKPDKVGLIMSMFGFGAIFSSFIIPGISDKVGRKPMVVIAALTGLFYPIAIFLVHSDVLSMMILFALGATASSAMSLTMATIPSESVEPDILAGLMGLTLGICEILGSMVMPLVSGYLTDMFGMFTPVTIMSILCVSSAILALFLKETAPAKRKHAEIEIQTF